MFERSRREIWRKTSCFWISGPLRTQWDQWMDPFWMPFLTHSPKCLESRLKGAKRVDCGVSWNLGLLWQKNRDKISDADERELEITNCGIQPELEMWKKWRHNSILERYIEVHYSWRGRRIDGLCDKVECLNLIPS